MVNCRYITQPWLKTLRAGGGLAWASTPGAGNFGQGRAGQNRGGWPGPRFFGATGAKNLRQALCGGGLTLVELLVVVVIVTVLVSLLLPAVQRAREAARRAACRSHLKQFGVALLQYADHHGSLPPGYFHAPGYRWGGFGWATCILPYLECDALYSSINFDHAAWHPANATACEQQIAVFLCPSDDTSFGTLDREGFRYGLASYVASFGPGTQRTGVGSSAATVA
jgi:type II secretory pathway pseudopilin PulG